KNVEISSRRITDHLRPPPSNGLLKSLEACHSERSAAKVESRKGAGTGTGAALVPFPAHRTGRADLPHPALRQVSPPDSRTGRSRCGAQAQHAQRTKEHSVGENARATRGHLLPPFQEMPDANCHMVIDRAISRPPGSVAEVVRPAAQDAIQPVALFGPRFRVVGGQHAVHLLSQARQALLRRTRPQVLTASFPIVLRPERVTQKVEALLP